MQKEQRLTKAKDFASVRHHGRKCPDRLLVLMAMPNGLDKSRIGIAVGRRVGRAVVRNRIKRRLREAIKQIGIEPGWDIVIVARQESSTADFHSLNRNLFSTLKRAGISPTSSLDTVRTSEKG